MKKVVVNIPRCLDFEQPRIKRRLNAEREILTNEQLKYDLEDELDRNGVKFTTHEKGQGVKVIKYIALHYVWTLDPPSTVTFSGHTIPAKWSFCARILWKANKQFRSQEE